MDVFVKEKRSDIMRQVKGNDNKSTEQRLIKFFKEQGIKGWKRNYKLYGKPDFVFRKQKTAVFVDGCFWHGHDCRNTRPKQNKDYWERKRARNMKRDVAVNERLQKLGWNVIRIWECELKKCNRNKLLEKLIMFKMKSD